MKMTLSLILFAIRLTSADLLPQAPVQDAHKPSLPIHWAIGQSLTVSAYGAYAEVTLDNVWAVQIQHYRYEEFQGIFNPSAPSPANEFSLTSGNIGMYAKFLNFKLGVFTGVGQLDGVVRGRGGGVALECSDGCNYPALEGRRFVVPLKFVIGVHGKFVGVSLSPQLYFHDGPLIANALFNVEAGWL